MRGTLASCLAVLASIATVDPSELPPQTVHDVTGIPSISAFWEFKPVLPTGLAPEERPVVVALHGNALKIRGNPRATVTADVSGARLFARFPQDFDLSEAVPEPFRKIDPHSYVESMLGNFRAAAARHHWAATVVSPVLSRKGPWDPTDVVSFVETYVFKRHFPSSSVRNGSSSGGAVLLSAPPKRLYLVGSSVGGVGVLRVLQHTSMTAPWSYQGLFAAAAVVSPGCGPLAGPEFAKDLYCVMPKRHVDKATTQGIAASLATLRVPLLAYHGDRDGLVPLINTRRLVDEVRAHGGFAALRVLRGCAHEDVTWAQAFAGDVSLWAFLLQHDLSTPKFSSSSSSSQPSQSSSLPRHPFREHRSGGGGGRSDLNVCGDGAFARPAHCTAAYPPIGNTNDGSLLSTTSSSSAQSNIEAKRPAESHRGSVFPCLPKGTTEQWEHRPVALGLSPNPNPVVEVVPKPPAVDAEAGKVRNDHKHHRSRSHKQNQG